MLALPLFGFTIFSIWGFLNKKQVVNDIVNLQKMAKLSVKVSALVHELQKERGATAGFLGSQGQDFKKALHEQQKTTDLKIGELKKYYKDFDKNTFPTVQKNINLAFNQLNKLLGNRRAVGNMSISVQQAIAYYTRMNTVFLNTISTVSKLNTNAKLSALLFSYLNFLQGKERAGIERAVLSNTFGAGKFQSGMFQKFSELVAEQKTYYRIFQDFAPEKIRTFYHNKMRGNIIEEDGTNTTYGEIAKITLTGGGSGYSTLPTITVTSRVGTSASLFASTNDIGSILDVAILDNGFNYKSIPNATVPTNFILNDIS